jgi:hypothetical protein
VVVLLAAAPRVQVLEEQSWAQGQAAEAVVGVTSPILTATARVEIANLETREQQGTARVSVSVEMRLKSRGVGVVS